MKNVILGGFKQLLPSCKWEPTAEQLEMLEQLCKFAQGNNYILDSNFEKIFVEAVNNKLALNRGAYQQILDEAFLEKITLNYLLKTEIKTFLDSADVDGYRAFLSTNKMYTERMVQAFQPVSYQRSIEAMENLIAKEKLYKDVLCSIFSRFCFNLFPKQCVYAFFSGIENTSADYYEFIGSLYPDIELRDNALGIIDVPESLFRMGYEAGCNRVFNEIQEMYLSLNNHCDMIIYIPPIRSSDADYQWRLYSDCILFAEKHNKEHIYKTYFRWKKIEAQTIEYINQIVPDHAEFACAFQGFVFKDCFVIGDKDGTYALMLVFEKNVRDERLINCPACRTRNIQGNSYPILNVRSWECKKGFCRGYRYLSGKW